MNSAGLARGDLVVEEVIFQRQVRLLALRSTIRRPGRSAAVGLADGQALPMLRPACPDCGSVAGEALQQIAEVRVLAASAA